MKATWLLQPCFVVELAVGAWTAQVLGLCRTHQGLTGSRQLHATGSIFHWMRLLSSVTCSRPEEHRHATSASFFKAAILGMS